jgi:hypothetical protein
MYVSNINAAWCMLCGGPALLSVASVSRLSVSHGSLPAVVAVFCFVSGSEPGTLIIAAPVSRQSYNTWQSTCL